MNFGSIVWAAIQPILSILIMVAVGVALKKKNIYGQDVMKSLGVFALQFLAPCLMLTKTASSISVNNIHQYLSIMLIAFIYQMYSFVAAFIIFYSTRKYLTPTFRKSLLSAMSFGNVGDFPIAILLTVGNAAPFNPGDGDKGVAFITAILLIYYPLFFSLGIYWIESDYKSLKVEYPKIHAELEPLQHEPERPEKPKFWRHPLFRMIIVNPNIIGIVIGLCLGLVQPLNDVFVSSNGALFFIFNTLKTLGNAYIPIGLTLFGANLIYADFSIFKRLFGIAVESTMATTIYIPIFIVVFTRLVISPILGIAFVTYLTNIGFIDPTNKILQFVLMTPMMMPMAQMNLVLSQIYHPKGKPQEMATMVAICYCFAPISLVVSLSVAIYSLS